MSTSCCSPFPELYRAKAASSTRWNRESVLERISRVLWARKSSWKSSFTLDTTWRLSTSTLASSASASLSAIRPLSSSFPGKGIIWEAENIHWASGISP